MDSYKEDNPEFRKQLLIPLAVLLLCAISLTAVGFAYMHASELEIEKNGLDGNYYEIDYTDSSGVAIEDTLDVIDFSAYTHISVDTSNGGRTFDAYLNGTTVERTFYVTLHTDMGDDVDFTLTATVDFGTVLSQFMTLDSVSYGSADRTAVNNGDTVAITLTMSVTDQYDVKTITGITPSGSAIEDRDDLVDALESICTNTYTVNVTAEQTA